VPKVALTDRLLKSLQKPSTKRIRVWDAAQPNFAVRVSKTGTISFVVVKRQQGHAQPMVYLLGHYPTMSLADARAKARDAILQLSEGDDPREITEEKRRVAAEQARTAKVNTFAAVGERFIRHYEGRNLRARASAAVVSIIRRELIPVWGDRPFTSITRRDIRELITAIKDRGEQVGELKRRSSGGPHAARHAFAACSRVFRWAVEEELSEVDPTQNINAERLHGLDKSQLQRERVLSDDELRIVWAAAEAASYPFGALVKLLLLTGARLREWSDASWVEIDLDDATLTVPTTRMKGKIAHVVPLCPVALELVHELPRFVNGDHLFSTTAGKRPISGFSKYKRKFDLTAASLGEVAPHTLHDLRRTARTGLAAAGVPPFIAELVIGHTQRGVHAIYDRHRYDAEKRDALMKWQARLLSIVAPEPPGNVVRLQKVKA
jgi:integrase